MNNGSHQPTIMVVDDTPANLRLLQDMLQDSGYRVVAFPGGRLALSAAARHPPDLILLDITMPDLNGYEVCERLKAEEGLKEIPVIFISALGETTEKVRAFTLGGVDYVTKPFQIEEVRARVRTHLALRSMQIELERHNHHLEEMVREQVKEIADSQMATTIALASLTESRDDTTGKHICRTQEYCRVLAENLRGRSGGSRQIIGTFGETIFLSAALHDIGKVGIPDRILLKPGKLTPEEFEIMKAHARIGAETLESAHRRYPRNGFLAMGIAISRSHHERWDGNGYPDGLAGEAIPLSARIMALADVYDALRSKRPYKPAFSREMTCSLIREGVGRQFDPLVYEAFASLEAEFAEIWERLADPGSAGRGEEP